MTDETTFQVIGAAIELGGIRIGRLDPDIPASLRALAEDLLHGDSDSELIGELHREIGGLEDDLARAEANLETAEQRLEGIENSILALDDGETTLAVCLEEIRAMLAKKDKK